MIRLLAILLLPLTAHAAKLTTLDGWQACDTAGKSVPIYKAAGDSITLDVPRYPSVVAFLTSNRILGDLTGKTLSCTLFIEASPDALWTGGNPGGCSYPPNMRLYFTSVPGPYKLMNGWKSPSSYWWSQTSWVQMDAVDGGTVVTLLAPVVAGQWSNATGQLTGFSGQAVQAGLAFGNGCFYDTGVATSQGSATIHVLSLTVQ